MNLTSIYALGLVSGVAGLCTYILVPVVRWLAPALGMVDMPGERRIHKQPIPRCGGIAVFIGFHAGCLVLFASGLIPPCYFLSSAWWWRHLVLSSLLLVVGLLDDAFGVRAWVKLAAQVAVALLAFHFGVHVGKLFGWNLPVAVDMLLTVLWCVGIVNAFNLIDGMDGLASGLAIIAATGIGGGLFLHRATYDPLVLAALAGACLAFLRFNFHPASIFLGDSGSMFIGLTLAVTALSTGSKDTAMASIGVPLLAVGVPIFDAFLAVWRRATRKALGKTGVYADGAEARVFAPDKDHLHHRLLRAGISDRKVAAWLYLLAAALVGIGMLSYASSSHTFGLGLCAFVIVAYVVVKHLARIELWESGALIASGLRRPPRRAFAVLLYPPLDILLLGGVLMYVLSLIGPDRTAGHPDGRWLDEVAIWVGGPLLTLWASRAYARVWSHARVSEFAITALAILAGILLAGGLLSTLGKLGAREMALTMTTYAGAAIPALMGLRALPRLVHDALWWAHQNRPTRGQQRPKMLLVGAGYGCTLFLRQRSLSDIRNIDHHPYVIGLVDDDRNLRGRRVHGYRVLGGTAELDELVRQHGVSELVITTEIWPCSLARVLNVARACQLRVWRWNPTLEAVDVELWSEDGAEIPHAILRVSPPSA